MISFGKGSEKEKARRILQKNDVRVFFVGIGGVSMSALALLLKERGAAVFGSDVKRSKITDMLQRRGIGIRFAHTKEAIMSFRPDIAVFSLSVGNDNSEYKAALSMNIPTISRAELLGIIMEEYQTRVGVSGSHGKSTVSAMLASILTAAGCEPTALCGAEISETFGLKTGKRDYLVYEACEYGDSFLELVPNVQLILNLELDHTDYFKSEDSIRESFLKCANRAKDSCIINLDSENLALISKNIKSELHTFSRTDVGEYRYNLTRIGGGSYSFKLYKRNEPIGEYFPRLKGEFNAINAVAAAVCADVLGLPYLISSEAIGEFSGIKRRLELINNVDGIDVFYDYAHHPSEISAVRDALLEMGYRKNVAIFAPHTYSRTASFLSEFAEELAKFNTVYVLDIYGAREKAVVGVSSSSLAEATRLAGANAHAVGGSEVFDTVNEIKQMHPDCVVLMGAGELDEYKEAFSV